MAKLVGQGNPGEQPDSNTGQNGSTNCFDAVGREIAFDRHADSSFPPHEIPIRRLCFARVYEEVVLDEVCGDLW